MSALARADGRARRRTGPAALALLTALAAAPAVAQNRPDLVTPDVLRVCADPANMPYSSRTGEGFEDRIAAIIADELKVGLRHYWMPQGPGFVRNTLGLKLCDVMIGTTAGSDVVQNSNPYYRSTYALLLRRGDLPGVDRLGDPRLQGKRIGVVAGSPPIEHLGRAGLLDTMRTYALIVDRRYASPADEMAADLKAGRIDLGVLWGPLAGDLARRDPELVIVPLVHEAGRPHLAYRITLGLRHNELDWRRTLNTVLRRREADITRVLLEHGVPLLDEEDRIITAERRP
ncbi:quinoprotein dehydrogenase-associated putative ABC transporter substrate-binding protein [Salinarimonas soli]|uniref:Quinoprotein dehydrogenase-associated putative ABC transporter substrate-binding protein n=1 Tax=Salinarimonas soli TaxID=1638099 RepID=A0A5B2VGM0_9HYPH|nr:quinoprotein dehydrogenase-associated putative ABC transporter substrate-binding protein [Salinarimonas soli]KAA2237482.1 quinoprotein dehydrogenase-associated putative ABC transporter substrate-binding protein [Salinarimonas soli]